MQIKNEVEKIRDINFQFNEDQMAQVEEKYQYANGYSLINE